MYVIILFFLFFIFFLSLSAAVVTGASMVKAPLPVFLLVMQVCTKSTLLALSIGTDKPEQTVKTQIRCCRMQHLIRIYTVCHSSSSLYTHP